MLLEAETDPTEGLTMEGPWSYNVSKIYWILSSFKGEVAQSNL